METFKGHWACPNGCRLLSELRRRHRNSRFLLRPSSMHCLLSFTFVTFLILWPLSPAASSVFLYRSCLVCSGLAYEIYSGGCPYTYVHCVVCYHVIVAPYVRSVGHVFAYIYNLDDDLECTMDYETSSLPKVFPLSVINVIYKWILFFYNNDNKYILMCH